MVRPDHALNTPLVESDVLLRWNGHEVVGTEGLWIDLREQFPFLPAVVMFRRGKAERLKGSGRLKSLFPSARAKNPDNMAWSVCRIRIS